MCAVENGVLVIIFFLVLLFFFFIGNRKIYGDWNFKNIRSLLNKVTNLRASPHHDRRRYKCIFFSFRFYRTINNQNIEKKNTWNNSKTISSNIIIIIIQIKALKICCSRNRDARDTCLPISNTRSTANYATVYSLNMTVIINGYLFIYFFFPPVKTAVFTRHFNFLFNEFFRLNTPNRCRNQNFFYFQ